MMTSYIIETSRLGLRELVPSDAKQMFDLNNDPDVLLFTGDSPFPSIDATRKFLEDYPDYKLHGFGRWGVIIKETEELIGWCGLKRDKETNKVDIGYRLFKAHWGKGYATEAARACLDFGINELNLLHIVGTADKDNSASIRVFEKLGMKHVDDFEEDGYKCVYQVPTDLLLLTDRGSSKN
jgi:RimJ/RimL family protein N-acetyltransferase